MDRFAVLRKNFGSERRFCFDNTSAFPLYIACSYIFYINEIHTQTIILFYRKKKMKSNLKNTLCLPSPHYKPKLKKKTSPTVELFDPFLAVV